MESQANGFVIVFDPTDAYGTEQIEAKQNAIGILQDKFVLAIDGQAQEMPYSMMPSDLTKKDVIAGLNQNKTMIITVLSVLIFLVTAAGKFIEVSFLALIGVILKNAQKKHLSYHQLWKLSAYSITLSTVFFTIMRALEATVPSEFLLNWFVNFVILFLVLKEIPSKKAAV